MRKRLDTLWARLALASLLATWLAIGLVALSVQSATETGFRRYVQGQNAARLSADLITALEAHYAEHSSWEGVRAVLLETGQGGGQGRGAGPGQAGGRGAQIVVADPDGVIVAAEDEALVGTRLSAGAQEGAVQLHVAGQVVGLLAQVTPGAQAFGEAEAAFLAQTRRALAVAAAGAGLLAVALAAVIAWGITRPLRTLTEAARDLSGGGLGRQVAAGGPAEMKTLAEAFNAMSRDLAEGEQQRQRMAADVAHELRTPVSVLRGRLEAMLDGVFPLDEANLAVAYDQTQHIARLVDDLRLLTQAEAGRLPLERHLTAPGELVEKAAALFAPLALDGGVTLEQEIAPDLPPVLVDADRLQQVLANLLSNALRHTPQGGRISLRLTREGQGVRFAVRNTGQPLTPEEAAHIFDRFWRAEEARARDSGGSGLGLAIARQIVQLHGGEIHAESEADAMTFVFTLPAAGQPARPTPP